MTKIRKTIAWVLTLVLLVTAAGCSSGATPSSAADSAPASSQDAGSASGSEEAAPTQEVIKIGVSLGETGDVFDRILYEGMLKYQSENSDKVELQILDAKGDINVQLTNVEQLINSNVDVILLWPRDVDALTVAVEAANAKNIPVVCVNTRTSGGEYTYVGSDDVEAGRIQGEWLAENLPENATYCYFMGPMGHSGQIGRKQGLEEVLTAKRPDVKMLSEQSAQWQRDKALNIADDYLKSFPEVSAMLSQNDNMALGIIEALRTANRIGDILVAGTDATEEACQSIKKGELSMSVFQNAEKQGYESVKVAHLTVMGEWKDGDYLIPFEAVDSSNVDQYIAMYEAAK